MGKFFDWLDHRTGYRRLRDALLIEHIPGGARWRYVWGSTLVFVFMIQLVTGILLMTAYVPGDEDAWGSVYFIQYEMDFGWLIRGLHHFGSQTMVVLIGIHMLQVVIAGAHLPPREINWWLGLALMGIVLGMSLTGYLLPWDQKGYYATQVATNIMGHMPVLGPFIQKVLVGGTEYGHQTLTHFYALHVGILPPLLIVFVVLHLTAFRRHGVTAPKNAQGQGHFWPDQAFRDLVVCLVIFGIMIALVMFGGHGQKIETPGADVEHQSLYESWAKAGREGRGANLDAPADPATEGYPARPEWYFLFLFQLLKYFQGDQEIIGTLVIPGAVGLLLFIVPLLGYGRMRAFAHFFGILVVSTMLIGVGVLTLLAFADDSPTFDLYGLAKKTPEAQKKAVAFQKRLKEAEKEAKIAVQSAGEGIPAEGGRYLVRGNPLIVGKKLFKQNCATCHAYDFKDEPEELAPAGEDAAKKKVVTLEPRASDLTGFASEKWIRGLLENPGDKKFFGRTPRLSRMVEWREGVDELINSGEDDAKKKERKKEVDFQLDEISWWLAEQAKTKDERTLAMKEETYANRYKQGKLFFVDDEKGQNCASCHHVDGEGNKGPGPELSGYGSSEWIHGMILSPGHKSRYGGTVKVEGKKEPRNVMPAFRPPPDNPAAKIALQEFLESQPDFPARNLLFLTDHERELVVRFLMGDPRVVFGGQPIAGPRKRK